MSVRRADARRASRRAARADARPPPSRCALERTRRRVAPHLGRPTRGRVAAAAARPRRPRLVRRRSRARPRPPRAGCCFARARRDVTRASPPPRGRRPDAERSRWTARAGWDAAELHADRLAWTFTTPSSTDGRRSSRRRPRSRTAALRAPGAETEVTLARRRALPGHLQHAARHARLPRVPGAQRSGAAVRPGRAQVLLRERRVGMAS